MVLRFLLCRAEMVHISCSFLFFSASDLMGHGGSFVVTRREEECLTLTVHRSDPFFTVRYLPVKLGRKSYSYACVFANFTFFASAVVVLFSYCLSQFVSAVLLCVFIYLELICIRREQVFEFDAIST